MGSLSLPQGNLPNPGIEPRFPALQADSLPAEPPGKPRNTGVGSPSLLRWIFLTQESNWGLLHHRWILYQLSYQGSPILHMIVYIYVNPSLSVLSDSLQPHGRYIPWNSPGQNTGVGSLSLPQGNLPNPGIKPRVPPFQVDSLPAEP